MVVVLSWYSPTIFYETVRQQLPTYMCMILAICQRAIDYRYVCMLFDGGVIVV